MRPTLKAVGLFSLSAPVAAVVVIVIPEVWYMSLYLPLAVLMVMAADLVMALPSGRLLTAMAMPSRLYVGHGGQFELSLEAPGYARPVPIEAVLELKDPAEGADPVGGTMTDGRLSLTLPIQARRRGQIQVKTVWLRWKSPFGLLMAKSRRPVGQTIEIIPDVHNLHASALRFYTPDVVHGQKNQKHKGEGTEFETLCEYQPGMDTRFIDWKRSARHRKLLCKEFRQERNQEVVLGFDTGHLMLEPVEGVAKLDHAIKAGLLLGLVSLKYGDLVGGCGFDARFRAFIRPGRGLSYFTQVQHFTANLTYQTEETNFTLGLVELDTRLKRRALVVLFTDFIDRISAELLIENIQLISRRHVVVFVAMGDPMLGRLVEAEPDNFSRAAQAVIASDFMRERAIVLERISRLGVYCLDVPVKGLSTALLNQYLLIKQRGLL